MGKKILFVFCLAMLIRLAMVFVWHEMGKQNQIPSDGQQHYAFAQGLMKGEGLHHPNGQPLSRRAPFYSVFLAGILFFAPFPLGVHLAQALLGAVSCVLLFFLARILFDERVALLASILMAFDYYLVRQTVSVLPEVLFIFFVLFCFLFVYLSMASHKPWWMVAAGLAAGFSLLTKPVLLLFFPFLGFWFLFGIKGASWRQGLIFGILFLGSVMLVVMPWTIRNRVVHGHWVLITATTGINLYAGNNPGVIGRLTGDEWSHLDSGDLYTFYKDITPFSAAFHNPVVADRYLFKKAVDFIREKPKEFLRLSGIRFLRFWFPYYSKSHLGIKILTTIFLSIIILFAIVGIVKSFLRWREFMPIGLLLLYVVGIHSIMMTSIRYRQPIMPFLIMFAAFGFLATIRTRVNKENHL